MIIPEDFGQVNMYFVGAALPRNAQLTFGISNVGEDLAADIAAVVGAQWIANIAPLMPATVTLERVKVKLGPNDTGPEATVAIGAPGELDEAEPMSPNVSILVNKVTATGGRKGAGKWFIPGFPEDDTDGGGLLIAARLAVWLGALGDFYDAMTTAGYPMHVLHTDVTAPTAVIGLVPQQRLATQKRRLRRAGGRRAVAP